jgi:hypothetical protein
VTLDGTGSYDPDGYGALSYQWRQVSGTKVTMSGTNTATPVVSGFHASSSIQKYTFELSVSDGVSNSAPSQVVVTVVPNYVTNALILYNATFDPTKPTILAFSGGNCSTGVGLNFGGVWLDQANWLTVNNYGPSYSKYGDMLIVYLSSVAPRYSMPIQTMGWSTGNLPAMEVGRYVNVTYRDARYAVNRISLLDAVCNNLSSSVNQYNANPVAGEQCWIDNYISNDPTLSRAAYLAGCLDVTCIPARAHAYPPQRYDTNSLSYGNGGLVAFGYLSVIGDGKNYQLNTASNKYYFAINSTQAITLYSQSSYPGKILAPVILSGPDDGATIGTNGAVLGCGAVENAVRYQVLLGADLHRVMDFAVVSETTNVPSVLVTNLPYQQTWWTVKAYDQFGSSIYADPRLLQRPEYQPPVADAGTDQTVYADLSGNASVTLDGLGSRDPEGSPLAYTWAWAIDGTAYETNGAQPTIELPIGINVVQLRVDDGVAISEPAQVTITVVAPLQGMLKVTPQTINRKSNQPNIKAELDLPDGISKTDFDFNTPLTLYPASVIPGPDAGGVPASRQWGLPQGEGQPGLNALMAFFDKDAVMNAVPLNGDVALKVVGQLKSGQWFYGDGTVTILGK